MNQRRIAPNVGTRLDDGDTVYIGVARNAAGCVPCDPLLEFRFSEHKADPAPSAEDTVPGPEDAVASAKLEELVQAVDKMKRDTECSICCENHVRPVQLANCPHTFCKLCIHEHLVKVGRFCPECRQAVEAPPTENLTVQGLVSTLVGTFNDNDRQER